MEFQLAQNTINPSLKKEKAMHTGRDMQEIMECEKKNSIFWRQVDTLLKGMNNGKGRSMMWLARESYYPEVRLLTTKSRKSGELRLTTALRIAETLDTTVEALYPNSITDETRITDVDEEKAAAMDLPGLVSNYLSALPENTIKAVVNHALSYFGTSIEELEAKNE